MQRRFVSDVSHELRTPLTTVRMAADVLHEAARRLRPGGRARSPSSCRPSWTGSRRCSPTCSRSAGTTPGAARPGGRADRPARCSPGSVDRGDGAPGRAQGQRAATCVAPGAPCVAEVDSRADRAGAAQPGRQRDRARRGPAGRGRGWPPTTTRSRSRVRDHGVGLRPSEAALVFNRFWRGRPGAGPHHRRHRAGPVDRAGGRAAARRLAAGLGRAGRRLPVPAHRGPPAGFRPGAAPRSRWSRSTRAAGCDR